MNIQDFKFYMKQFSEDLKILKKDKNIDNMSYSIEDTFHREALRHILDSESEDLFTEKFIPTAQDIVLLPAEDYFETKVCHKNYNVNFVKYKKNRRPKNFVDSFFDSKTKNWIFLVLDLSQFFDLSVYEGSFSIFFLFIYFLFFFLGDLFSGIVESLFVTDKPKTTKIEYIVESLKDLAPLLLPKSKHEQNKFTKDVKITEYQIYFLFYYTEIENIEDKKGWIEKWNQLYGNTCKIANEEQIKSKIHVFFTNLLTEFLEKVFDDQFIFRLDSLKNGETLKTILTLIFNKLRKNIIDQFFF